MTRHILVADTDREAREACCRILQRNGYDVRTADGGLDCILKMMQCRPAALMLDCGLLWGGADGVIEKMRHEPRLSSIPVLITIPAGIISESIELISRAGVESIQKPYRANELLRAINGCDRKDIQELQPC